MKILLNKQYKYLYENIVIEQYNNITFIIKDEKYGNKILKYLTIFIHTLDLYSKFFYDNKKFNFYNFMLFENLDDKIKEKINIIHCMISICEKKYVKFNYLELF